MELNFEQLISALKRSENYLSQRVSNNSNYSDLIKTLTLARESIEVSKKPLVKLVSPSIDLVDKLKAQAEANLNLRSHNVGCASPLYFFQAISPIQQISQIIRNCDVICLIYNSRHNIKQHHYELIELAKQQSISLLILVVQQKVAHPYTQLSQWLAAQDYPLVKQLIVADDFCNLDDEQNLDVFYQSLVKLAPQAKITSEARIISNITTNIKDFFRLEINNIRQKIRQYKEDSQVELLAGSQADVRQIFNSLRQEIQQFLRISKQAIQQSKSDYLNPFLPDSWMFLMQESLESSQVKITPEKGELYLDLIITNEKNTEYFHSYILNFYQQQVIEALDFQWSQISYDYGDCGLQGLVRKINSELETLNSLYLSQIDIPKLNFLTEPKPNLYLAEIINSHCLKKNTRITFDYNYTQSNWFRLIISLLIGISIYLVTKLYLGTGKYIGFFILIFQLINLLTGQNIKTLKLKQHQKELKRTVDNKYQVLLRLIVEQLTQTLINSLESHVQLYQQQIDAIANQLQSKSEATQTIINQYKSSIDNLQQDQEQILTWLNKLIDN